MTLIEIPPIKHDQIARLAYLNWEKDGCPQGHDKKYWLEAEQQIKATGHFLIRELSLPADQPAVAAKFYPNRTLKKRRARNPGNLPANPK
ncbi:MAG TPA: DUF2934 domain-containing protein [Verrucomicrobiae bacterium]|nr:DUF2934 domain-containing protein [Verrucomicrobiae bacterium]